MGSGERIEGWIEIVGLRCEGAHGAYPGERDRTRLFLVDIAVRADVTAAVASDDLAAATDIAAVARAARAHLGGTSHALLEPLAHGIASDLLARFPAITEARVRVVKPRPDGLDADAEAVAVSLTRPPRGGRGPSARRGRPDGRRAPG